jgi:transcription-repair coupling factor (superfamily II helicase)
VEAALVRNTASQLGIREITQTERKIILYPETPNFAAASRAAEKMQGRVTVGAGQKPFISVTLQKDQSPVEAIRETLGHMSGV